jgi:hypothetical protein
VPVGVSARFVPLSSGVMDAVTVAKAESGLPKIFRFQIS